MASAITKRVEDMREKHAATLARARAKAKDMARATNHTMLAAASSYAIGAAEKRAIALPTVRNLDPKLLYGGIALAAAYLVRDAQTRAIAQSVGDGLVSVVAYNQAKYGDLGGEPR